MCGCVKFVALLSKVVTIKDQKIKLFLTTASIQIESFNSLLYSMQPSERLTYGFFHPFCNAGGGGERVLWQAVQSTLEADKKCRVIIYTADKNVTDGMILLNVLKRFDIELDRLRTKFVYLEKGYLVQADNWSVFTLLGQAFGSILLCYEALKSVKPDIFIDTMGYPFVYPLVSCWLGIPIIAYVHYPVISKDMLNKLHVSIFSTFGLKQLLKYIYWKIFMILYTIAGSFVDITLTNSTWTNNHVKSIWWLNQDIEILYPPCSTQNFIDPNTEENEWNKENTMICIAQFRPEKRHDLIIEEYSKFLLSSSDTQIPKLIFIGSIRDKDDENNVKRLKLKAKDLDIPDSKIEFILDVKYEIIKQYLKSSSIGLNAMWNEHFGIAVVEYIANGLIPIVHASAGPLLDIVVPWDVKQGKQVEVSDSNTRTGFFFQSEADPDYDTTARKYPRLFDMFTKVSQLSDQEKLEISKRGQACVLHKFSDAKFEEGWVESIKKAIQIKRIKDRSLMKKTPLYIWFLIPLVSALSAYLKSKANKSG